MNEQGLFCGGDEDPSRGTRIEGEHWDSQDLMEGVLKSLDDASSKASSIRTFMNPALGAMAALNGPGMYQNTAVALKRYVKHLPLPKRIAMERDFVEKFGKSVRSADGNNMINNGSQPAGKRIQGWLELAAKTHNRYVSEQPERGFEIKGARFDEKAAMEKLLADFEAQPDPIDTFKATGQGGFWAFYNSHWGTGFSSSTDEFGERFLKNFSTAERAAFDAEFKEEHPKGLYKSDAGNAKKGDVRALERIWDWLNLAIEHYNKKARASGGALTLIDDTHVDEFENAFEALEVLAKGP